MPKFLSPQDWLHDVTVIRDNSLKEHDELVWMAVTNLVNEHLLPKKFYQIHNISIFTDTVHETEALFIRVNLVGKKSFQGAYKIQRNDTTTNLERMNDWDNYGIEA